MRPPTPATRQQQALDAGDEQTVAGGRREGVFDLDAAVADALRDPFPFTYGGPADDPYEWTMQHPGAVDYRDAEAADGGNIEAVRKVIACSMGATAERGPDGAEFYVGEQWEAFDELRLPAVALDRLFRAWLDFYGIAPGELSGSAAQFASTAAPSNRASRRQAARSNSGSSSPRAGGGTSRR